VFVTLSPRQAYAQALDEGFHEDPAQRRAIDVLETCHQALHSLLPRRVQGVYLYGPVGRGKTWLMDRFHASLRVASRREHFHHFMRWVHRRLFELTGQPDPIHRVADELAAELKVLCLDELFINDIGDAMILGRLFQRLFEKRLVLVMTSNQPPSELYANGHHRDRLQPAIRAIEANMQLVDVRGPQDHRLHPGALSERFWTLSPGEDSRMPALFFELAGSDGRPGPIALGPRRFEIERHAERVIWCSYDQLCEASLWANDYIELCDRYDHVLISAVPQLVSDESLPGIARGTEDAAERVATGDRRMPHLTRRDNGVRRFIALIDECYDRRVPVYLEAAVALDQLYPAGYLEFEFRRTLSRLREMQLARFGLA
jgi:cell division protein ZapE